MKVNLLFDKNIMPDEITFSDFSGRLIFYLQRNDDFFADKTLEKYGNLLIDKFSSAKIKTEDEKYVRVTLDIDEKAKQSWDDFIIAIKCGFHLSRNHLLSLNAERMASIKEYAFSVNDLCIIEDMEL